MRNLRRSLVAVLVVLVSLAVSMFGGAAVSAHTGFESSTPSAGAVVDAPVELVTIVFTGEASPVGDEFIALTPEGIVQAPVNVETLDNKLFSIRFDPPLAGGQVGLRWNVQAADAHPIEGAFSFTVTAPAPTTVPATTVPATTAPASSTATTIPASTAPPTTSAVAAGDAPTTLGSDDDAATLTAADPPTSGPAEATAGTQRSLDDFLTVDNSTPGETTATIGRLVGLLGVILGLGALAFGATALRGHRHEVRRLLAAVRVLGVVVVVGAAIEYIGVARIGDQPFADGWSTAPGFATLLRVIGGIGVAVGIGGTISSGQPPRATGDTTAARSLSSAAVDDIATQPGRRPLGEPTVRWTPDARSWPAMIGVVLIIVSFWFDGHTVSKGFRPLHAAVNTVHVAAGAIWVGGVVAMAAVIWSRHRTGQPMRVVELVVRFSKIATIVLVAVVVAGGLMAVLVLDSFGDLTGTQWGRIFLLKTAAVGLAAVGGAYNHFRLVPALEDDPESPEVITGLRNTVTAEAIILVFVVTVTAWLVAAAS